MASSKGYVDKPFCSCADVFAISKKMEKVEKRRKITNEDIDIGFPRYSCNYITVEWEETQKERTYQRNSSREKQKTWTDANLAYLEHGPRLYEINFLALWL